MFDWNSLNSSSVFIDSAKSSFLHSFKYDNERKAIENAVEKQMYSKSKKSPYDDHADSLAYSLNGAFGS